MGQVPSQPLVVKDSKEVVSLCEVVGGAVIHAARKLEEYLGFEDPLSNLRAAPSTLNEIFLIHFVTLCRKKGVEGWFTTTKMTKHQASLFGADWIWTFWASDKQIRFQLAVQTLQLSSFPLVETKPCQLPNPGATTKEACRRRSRFSKLENFCRMIGEDCLGLFIIFGVPGKPKDIRGVVLDSVKGETGKEEALVRFVLETEDCVSIQELLGNCLSKKDGLREVGKAYISIL